MLEFSAFFIVLVFNLVPVNARNGHSTILLTTIVFFCFCWFKKKKSIGVKSGDLGGDSVSVRLLIYFPLKVVPRKLPTCVLYHNVAVPHLVERLIVLYVFLVIPGSYWTICICDFRSFGVSEQSLHKGEWFIFYMYNVSTKIHRIQIRWSWWLLNSSMLTILFSIERGFCPRGIIRFSIKIWRNARIFSPIFTLLAFNLVVTDARRWHIELLPFSWTSMIYFFRLLMTQGKM